MKRIWQSAGWAGLLAVALLAPAPAAAFANHREVHKTIEQLESEWRKAQLSNDWATMDKLLDDEYTGISTTGQIQTKEQAIAARKAHTLVLTKLDFSDVKVHVQPGGNAAVVTSRADVVGTNGGENISGRYRYMRVYEKKLGQWRIVNFIATPIDDHLPK
jgi:ketosteroid isomerase-like protein